MLLIPLLALPAALVTPSRFFLDTAVTSEWEALLPLGIFHGVTTNPVLLERAGVPCTLPQCRQLADTAFELGAKEVMLQAWGGSTPALHKSGLELSRSDRERIVVKVPVTEAGMRAAALLVDDGVRVCLTACYAAQQALVAAAVGAEYLAPYLGRMSDSGKDGLRECARMQSVVDGLARHGAAGGPDGSASEPARTRILVASIREVESMTALAELGCDTFTFSPQVARDLFGESLTAAAADDFERAARG